MICVAASEEDTAKDDHIGNIARRRLAGVNIALDVIELRQTRTLGAHHLESTLHHLLAA